MQYLNPLPRATDWQDRLVLTGCAWIALAIVGLALFEALA
jgi:hypothetical protein